ncbi:MAG: homocysteine S-methyltransferase family protein [Oscillospiraceae bacterium]|nr:homocysteine S-methyltransferase family protein [Oscillospiraceae bacterium]
MTKEAFRNLGTIILDGATGSNLMKAGMPRGVCAEKWILDNPHAIVSLQKAYAQSGSHVVYAPTFTASAPYLAQHGLDDQLEEINRDLVALTRSAVGEQVLVAGDMTTVGKPDLSYEYLLEVYTRQANALRDAGVDLYVIETMMGLEETMAALEACTMAADLPVMCSFSVTADGMLYFGGSIYDAAPQLEGFGADAVGINCSCGPDQMAAVVRTLAQSLHIPVIAKPNAGMPAIDDLGNAVYSMGAEEFAQGMLELKAAGASVLGGCCGTDPSYIRALTEKLR